MSVAEAKSNLAEAQANLAEALTERCPGQHRYRQYRDGLPAHCPVCGYTRDGQQVRR